MSKRIYSRIAGTGSYLPEKVLTNADLEKMVETSDEWIQSRTGIRERHIAADGETTSDLGYNAAVRALEAAGIDASQLDMIVVGTTTPDLIFPSTACLIQAKLGVAGCPAFDVNAACSGFVFALGVADKFIRSGDCRHVLVIGTETLTRMVDWNDRTTCVLFGDGAGAVVLKADEETGILSTHLHASLATRFSRDDAGQVGSKEVLCEEYLPAMTSEGIHCLLIVRDPRAVIASANHGRYRAQVGDRYPLLMLVRLWRKSARAWLAMAGTDNATVVRYEDLVARPDAVLEAVASALSIASFPDQLLHSPLRDHRGAPWKGNSSFGDKINVDAASDGAWMTKLSTAEARFIEACAKTEMEALGYAPEVPPRRIAISEFTENVVGVRPGYLEHYALGPANREIELARWDAGAGDGPASP